MGQSLCLPVTVPSEDWDCVCEIVVNVCVCVCAHVCVFVGVCGCFETRK